MPPSRPQSRAGKKAGRRSESSQVETGVERPTFLQRLSSFLSLPPKLRRPKSTPNIATSTKSGQPGARPGSSKAPSRHSQHPPDLTIGTVVAPGSDDPNTYYSFPPFRRRSSQSSLLSIICPQSLGSGRTSPKARPSTSDTNASTENPRHPLRSVFSSPAGLSQTTSKCRPTSAGKEYLSPEPRLHGAAHLHHHRPHGVHPTSSHRTSTSPAPRPTSPGSSASRTYSPPADYPPYKSASPHPPSAPPYTTHNSFLSDTSGTGLPLVRSAAALTPVDSVTALGEIAPPPDLVGELPRLQLRRKPRFSVDRHEHLEGYPKTVVDERSATVSASSAVAQPAARPEQAGPPPPPACGHADGQRSNDETAPQDARPRLRGGAGPDGRVPRVLWFTAGGTGRRPLMPALRLSDAERDGIVRGGLTGLVFGDFRRGAGNAAAAAAPAAAPVAAPKATPAAVPAAVPAAIPAAIPAAASAALPAAAASGAPAGEVKKDEPKKDEPKKDEPKKEAPAASEPKETKAAEEGKKAADAAAPAPAPAAAGG